MKIIITGSLGNISKPLATELLKKGHAVTVISSKPEKQKDIEAIGARAAIGSVENIEFLTATFTEADSIYCMVPPNFTTTDVLGHYQKVGSNYAAAIKSSGAKRIVHLSSFGADLDSGTGIILGSHQVEEILNQLEGVELTHMRPTYFYYNLLSFAGMIKGSGEMMANYGGDDRIVLVSPLDISAAIAEEILKPVAEYKIRYVASDELTGNDIASILGTAIGKPDLKWNLISNDQMQAGLQKNGVPLPLATKLVEMYGCLHSGRLLHDYDAKKTIASGKVKMQDYAKDFALIFNK